MKKIIKRNEDLEKENSDLKRKLRKVENENSVLKRFETSFLWFKDAMNKKFNEISEFSQFLDDGKANPDELVPINKNFKHIMIKNSDLKSFIRSRNFPNEQVRILLKAFFTKEQLETMNKAQLKRTENGNDKIDLVYSN